MGDALGVPVEFMDRALIARDPVTGMRAYGTHRQPAGTFSDDSSMAFCLAEALCHPFSLQRLADHFQSWLYDAYWTARGEVFDMGNATRAAILRLRRGVQPVLAGGFDEGDNGNGSLMRILPLALFIRHKSVQTRFALTKEVSSITHGHIRSVLACFIYLEMALQLMQGLDKEAAYRQMQLTVNEFLPNLQLPATEVQLFDRVLNGNIAELPVELIYSSGYVLHTLEASLWSLLTTDSYAAATLKAVNLGSDTDTTGAVTGGLAGILYGYENIPQEWMDVLARKADIEDLATRWETAGAC